MNMQSLKTKNILILCSLLLIIGCGRRLIDDITSSGNDSNIEDTAKNEPITLQLLISAASQGALPGLLGKQAIPGASSFLLKNVSSTLSSDEEALLYVGLLKQDNLVQTILGSLFGSEEDNSCDPYVLAQLSYDEKISLSICTGSYLFMIVKVASADNLADYEIIAMGTKEIDVTSTIDSVFKLDVDSNGNLLISNYTELIESGALIETNEDVPYYKTLDGSYDVSIDFTANLSGLNLSALGKNSTEGTAEGGIGDKDDYKSFTLDIAQRLESDGTLKSELVAESSLTSSFLNGSVEPIKVPFVESGCFRFDLEYRIPYGASGTCEKIINFNSSFACFTDVISSVYDAGGADIVGSFQVVETISGENCPIMQETQFANANGVFKMTKKGDPSTTYEQAQVAITEASAQATIQIPTKSYSVSISDLAKGSWCYDKNYSYSQMSETQLKALLLASKLITSSDATELSADIGVASGVVQFSVGSLSDTLNLEANYGYAYAYKDFVSTPYKVSGGCYSTKSNDQDLLSCYVNMYDSATYTVPYCAVYATFTTDPLAKADLGITPPPSGTISSSTNTDSKGQYIDIAKWKEYNYFTMLGNCNSYGDIANLYNGTEAYLKVEKNTDGNIVFTFNDANGNLIYKNEALINDNYYSYTCDSNNNKLCTSVSIDKNYYSLYVSVYDYYSNSANCNLYLSITSDYNFNYTPVALSNQVYKATLQETNQWGGKDYWTDASCDKGDYKAFFGTETFPTDIVFQVTLDASTKKVNIVAEINKSNSDSSDDKEITVSVDPTLNTWDVLNGKTSYSFYNNGQQLAVNLSNGRTSSANLSTSGSLTLEDTSNSKYPTYQYFSMYYSRYDNSYYNYCYISVYPSKIEKVE